MFCTTEAEIYSPCDYSPTEDPEAGLSFKQSLEEAFSRLNTSGIEYILINISYRARDDSLDDFINYNKLEEVAIPLVQWFPTLGHSVECGPPITFCNAPPHRRFYIFCNPVGNYCFSILFMSCIISLSLSLCRFFPVSLWF